MRKQCPYCLNPAPGHAHFCPRCGRVITRRRVAASVTLASGPTRSPVPAKVAFLLTLVVVVAGACLAVGGWAEWRLGHGGYLPAVFIGVFFASLGFSAAAALAVNKLSAGGTAVRRVPRSPTDENW
jgi:hypothetical protein